MIPLPRIAQRPARAPRTDRVAEIVTVAGAIVDAEGPAALTMRRVGADLGIKAPSLYKHLAGRDEIVALLVDDALFDAGDACHAAVDRPGRRTPVAALLLAYRALGRDQPNRYRLATEGTLPRSALTPGLEDWAGEPFFRTTGEPQLAQALWAFAHGMVALEIDGRFLPGSDLDRTWREGATVFSTRSTRPSATATRSRTAGR